MGSVATLLTTLLLGLSLHGHCMAGASMALPNIKPGSICEALVMRLPNVKGPLCINADLQATRGKSVQGRTIFSRDVSATSPQLRIMVIGCLLYTSDAADE